MRKFHQINNKAQATIEYMLLFVMVAIIVFFGLKDLLPKATSSSAGYFNEASGAIMGEPPPFFNEVRVLEGRIVKADGTTSRCDSDEYMTGGGCHWDEVESTGHTDRVADRTWTQPPGGEWNCDARAGGEKDTYVICYKDDYRCRRLQGVRHYRESTVTCDADEYLTGGGCFWDEVQVLHGDDVHGHPQNIGSTLGGTWLCHSAPSRDWVDSFAICCKDLVCRTYSAVGGTGSDNAADVLCPGIEFLTGGGCYFEEMAAGGTSDQVHFQPLQESGPTRGAGWHCATQAGGARSAFAICCR